MDRQGNCNVVLADSYIARVEGRPVPHRTPRGQTSMRAPGYKVLFSLLAEPDLVQAPLRTIAERAGASRQAASDTLARLVDAAPRYRRDRRTRAKGAAMTDQLIVLLGDARIGQVERDRRGKVRFTYEESFRNDRDAYPLSLSMPLARSEHGHDVVEPFLWNLLPDNELILERWARRFQVSARRQALGRSFWANADHPHPQARRAWPRRPRRERTLVPSSGARGRSASCRFGAHALRRRGRHCRRALRPRAPAGDIETFVDALAFNWIIAGTDAHAKNYSFLIGVGGTIRLAPLYDIASALAYESMREQKINLAMKVGGKYRVRDIGPYAWQKCATELGLDPAR